MQKKQKTNITNEGDKKMLELKVFEPVQSITAPTGVKPVQDGEQEETKPDMITTYLRLRTIPEARSIMLETCDARGNRLDAGCILVINRFGEVYRFPGLTSIFARGKDTKRIFDISEKADAMALKGVCVTADSFYRRMDK